MSESSPTASRKNWLLFGIFWTVFFLFANVLPGDSFFLELGWPFTYLGWNRYPVAAVGNSTFIVAAFVANVCNAIALTAAAGVLWSFVLADPEFPRQPSADRWSVGILFAAIMLILNVTPILDAILFGTVIMYPPSIGWPFPILEMTAMDPFQKPPRPLVFGIEEFQVRALVIDVLIMAAVVAFAVMCSPPCLPPPSWREGGRKIARAIALLVAIIILFLGVAPLPSRTTMARWAWNTYMDFGWPLPFLTVGSGMNPGGPWWTTRNFLFDLGLMVFLLAVFLTRSEFMRTGRPTFRLRALFILTLFAALTLWLWIWLWRFYGG
ncbi:MAG: hypothetical protein N2C14_09520 [Planctomycetales bacterium]